MSATAADNGINPSLLRRWVLEDERLGLHALEAKQETVAQPSLMVRFPPPRGHRLFLSYRPLLPAAMANPASHTKGKAGATDQIRIERGRDAVRICLDWPLTHGRELGQFMRELLA